MTVSTNLARVANIIHLYMDTQSMYFALGNYNDIDVPEDESPKNVTSSDATKTSVTTGGE